MSYGCQQILINPDKDLKALLEYVCKVLDEEVPRIGRLKQVGNAEEQINALLRAYLERWRDQVKPQNLDLTVFILGRTVESLTHAAVIECPELLSDGQLEQEITNLLLSYLVEKRNEHE